MIFEYSAKDTSGNDKNGQIEAQNENEAVSKLQEQGLIIISINKIGVMKCPFCAEEIEDLDTRCRHCGGILEKFKDWEAMLNKKEPEKRYFKTAFLIIAFLCIGPFALPLLWLNPRFSQKTKIITSVIVIILSYFLWTMFINSAKSILKYYQQVFNPTF